MGCFFVLLLVFLFGELFSCCFGGDFVVVVFCCLGFFSGCFFGGWGGVVKIFV